MADIAYKMLCLIKNYGEELNPRYLPARSKAAAKEFILDRDSTKLLIEKNVDKQGLKLFNYLSSSIGFFSSIAPASVYA